MINLSTPSDILWNTLKEEREKANYWLIKQLGGEKKYEHIRDKMLLQCAFSQKPQTSKVVEYTSNEGNRWICFEYAMFYPESLASHSMPYATCYYETASSLGMFLVGFEQTDKYEKMISVTIFTPHFFQRLSERLGITGSTREILVKFVKMTSSFTISPLPDDGSGLERVAIRFPGGVGLGIRREGKENIFEIRTVLTDEQQSNSQTKKTERVRALGDLMQFEPTIIRTMRGILNKDSVVKQQSEMDKLGLLGDEVYQRNLKDVQNMMYYTFKAIGVIQPDDLESFYKYIMESEEPIFHFMERCRDQYDNNITILELIKLAKEIAARLGVRKFKWRDFTYQLILKYYNVNKEEIPQYIDEITSYINNKK